MSRSTLRVAWYRFQTTAASRRGSYLSVILLVGLVGGVAMGAIAAGRRTQSSFPAYLASSNPSDFGAVTAVLNPLIGSALGYNPAILRTIAHLPHVKRVESASGVDVVPVQPDGAPLAVQTFPPAAGNGLGSDDGYGFDQDRMTVISGRLPDPRRADEVAVETEVAQVAHFTVGQHVLMGVYTNAQTQLPQFGTAKVKPYRIVDVTVTATVVLPHMLVEDDVDNSWRAARITPRPGSRCRTLGTWAP
jgi:hypothetical protein